MSVPAAQRLVLYLCTQVLCSTFSNWDIFIINFYEKNGSVHMRSAIGVSMGWNPSMHYLQQQEETMSIHINITHFFGLQHYACTHLPFHALFWQPVPPVGTSTTGPHPLIRPNHINPTTKVDCIIHLVWILDL